MSYASLDDLRSHLGGQRPEPTPAYREKMLHPIPPDITSVDRVKFILQHCTGKRVLEFGASGPLFLAIRPVTTSYQGVDRQDGDQIIGFDLDDVSQTWLPVPTYWEGQKWDLIVCGEILEHLMNPGWFLTRLRRQYLGIPVILTVPNAFADAGRRWILKGIENVNRDHVAYYSPKTVSVLLERVGYHTGGLFWYGGPGPTAEGLIVVTE